MAISARRGAPSSNHHASSHTPSLCARRPLRDDKCGPPELVACPRLGSRTFGRFGALAPCDKPAVERELRNHRAGAPCPCIIFSICSTERLSKRKAGGARSGRWARGEGTRSSGPFSMALSTVGSLTTAHHKAFAHISGRVDGGITATWNATVSADRITAYC